CILECVQDEHKQLELADLVKKALHENRNEIQEIEKILTDFSVLGYEKTQGITLYKLAKEFFVAMVKEINESVDSKIEMKDFAIAEVNLARFCEQEGLTEPEMLYAQKDDAEIEVSTATYFTPDLLGDDAIKQNERIKKNLAMINCIKDNVKSVVVNKDIVEFYTNEDPRMGRYFCSKALQKYAGIRVKTLAVLDDRSKYDYDLLFTTEGIMPIIKGRAKLVIPYNKIEWSNNDKKKELVIGVRYENEKLDMDALYNLIQKLKPYAVKIEKTFL
ncbi:MAG: hypothetical protein PHX08_22030, partial [Lachnospiraceae bacterium]|nr:hypothetical protein [Lachnospiraceae bacterium]